MTIHVSPDALRVISMAEDGVVLGVVARDGVVRLRLADAIRIQGHADWIRDEPMLDVHRGFSVWCGGGQAKLFCPTSSLNPGPGYRMEDELIEALRSQLPLSADFRVGLD